jgi:hypothetical protein
MNIFAFFLDLQQDIKTRKSTLAKVETLGEVVVQRLGLRGLRCLSAEKRDEIDEDGKTKSTKTESRQKRG